MEGGEVLKVDVGIIVEVGEAAAGAGIVVGSAVDPRAGVGEAFMEEIKITLVDILIAVAVAGAAPATASQAPYGG